MLTHEIRPAEGQGHHVLKLVDVSLNFKHIDENFRPALAFLPTFDQGSAKLQYAFRF